MMMVMMVTTTTKMIKNDGFLVRISPTITHQAFCTAAFNVRCQFVGCAACLR